MINFFEGHLGSITLLLTVGTFWMALSTRAAAKASKKIFELEARPCLVFNKPMFRIHQEKDENQIHVNTALTLGPVDVLRDSIGRIGANSQNTGSDTNKLRACHAPTDAHR
ncbi:hypothetical protein [Vreelandella maris]|uniref:Uncharacterized protein n=1 Tax=Vreelandella maris TaxID=2729617 RepID=A0A7Y6R9A8_9GAMM|nr:hypothetical protein [Halomonas maris]NVF12563.1 hypothetical protein [Halomonas maris]